jgi:hypothetical protein
MTTKAPLKTIRKGTSARPSSNPHGDERGGHTKEGEDQPNISPPVPELHIQRGIVLIPNRDRTVSTERAFVGVGQVPAKVLDEIVCPSRARFAQGWVEDGEFFRVASDFEVAGKRGRR